MGKRSAGIQSGGDRIQGEGVCCERDSTEMSSVVPSILVHSLGQISADQEYKYW